MESPKVIAETIVISGAETFPLKKDERVEKVERIVKQTKVPIEDKKVQKIVEATRKIVEVPKKGKRDKRDESSDSDDSDDGEFLFFLCVSKQLFFYDNFFSFLFSSFIYQFLSLIENKKFTQLLKKLKRK